MLAPHQVRVNQMYLPWVMLELHSGSPLGNIKSIGYVSDLRAEQVGSHSRRVHRRETPQAGPI